MTVLRTIPMLPCADIDEIAAFFGALGFEVAHRQLRPNPYLALRGHGFDLHYYGLDDHEPEASHSSCLIAVDDTGPIWEEFAERLRAAYGRVPTTGFPRMTKPRPRKNADGLSGFAIVDPAGNWLRVVRDASASTASDGSDAADQPASAPTRLGEALRNAIVLADSKGDVAQAAKILGGALGRASDDDPAVDEAREFFSELTERLPR